MAVQIKPSDLKYRYPRKHDRREQPKFAGPPDPAPFDRDDQYEVIPMLEAVMGALDSSDSDVLHRLEELLNHELPRCIGTREEVYDCLLGVMRDLLR